MRFAPILLLLLAAACRDQRPPAPSAEQANRLNDAEAMLNQLATNEEGPADRSTGPSNRSD
jgi:hypothetical protein